MSKPDRMDFDGGKYTVIYDNGTLSVLRYGVPWNLGITCDKLVYAMFADALMLKNRCKLVQGAYEHELSRQDDAATERDELLRVLLRIRNADDDHRLNSGPILPVEIRQNLDAVVAKVWVNKVKGSTQ